MALLNIKNLVGGLINLVFWSQALFLYTCRPFWFRIAAVVWFVLCPKAINGLDLSQYMNNIAIQIS